MKSFKIIKASAGSGKTFTLVKEYLKLCLLDETSAKENYKHILAITFTKAASNDMRRKITEALDNIIEDPEKSDMGKKLKDELNISPEKLKKNAEILSKQIIHDYSNFGVSTIDSFNQKISRSFAAELGLPYGYIPTIEKEEISEILTENIGLELSKDKRLAETLAQYVKTRMEEYEEKTSTRQTIIDYFNRIQDEKAFEKSAKTNCYDKDKYNETIDFLKNKIQETDNLIRQYSKNLKAIVQDNNLDDNCFYQKSKGIPGIINKLDSKDTEIVLKIYEQKISANIINGFVESGAEFKWYDDKAKMPNDELLRIGGEFCNIFKDLANLRTRFDCYCVYKTILKDLYLYVLRSKIEKEIDNIISEDEKVSISEFNKRIASVLGDYSVPFIYERLGERYKYIFIDEFQDTSILQWHNLIPLFANCLANGNTCLVVGDGKQAIYHFRNGEVKLLTSLPKIFQKPENTPAFDEYEKKFDDEKYFESLDYNWRTAKTIVDFNNNFFKYFINRSDFSQNLHEIYEDDTTGNKIEQKTPEKNENKKGHVQIEIIDGQEIALDDGATVSKDDYMLFRIYEIINELKGQYNYKDIAIITKRNSNCSDIAVYLSNRSIPVMSSVSLLLKSSKRVMLLVNSLSYFINNTNSATIAAILYLQNTLKGNTNNDKIFWAANKIAKSEETLESHLGLEDNALGKAQAQSYSLYDLCNALMRLYGFNTIEDPYVNYFIDTVQTWQTADNVGISKFLDFWEMKKHDLSIKMPDETNAIKIMTIHKAKGLEFPVVIYPFAKGSPSKQNKKHDFWIGSDLLFGNNHEHVPNINKIYLSKKTALADVYYNIENEAEDLGNINEIYVAMTRPKERLYILSNNYSPGDETQKDSNKANVFKDYLDEKDKSKACDKYKLDLKETINKHGLKAYTYSNLDPDEIGAAKSLTEPAIQDSRSCNWYEKLVVDEPETPLWLQDIAHKNTSPAEWGKAVHLLLSQIKTAKDIDTAFYDTTAIDDKTTDKLKDCILKIITNEAIAKAFSEDAKVKTECEILTKDLKIKRPDRYAELPDKIMLIDYKTGEEEDSHTSQMAEYANLVAEMVNKPIEKYIVYIRDNEIKIKKA